MLKICSLVIWHLVWLAVCFPACSRTRTDKRLDEWRTIARAETLDVFLKDRTVGTLTQSLTVVDSLDALCMSSDMAVTAGPQGSLRISGQRLYEPDGRIRSANQTVKGESGTNQWTLQKSSKDWLLTVVAGGVATSSVVASVKESIAPMLKLYKSIKSLSCRAGDVFLDTEFEIVSQKTIISTTRCTAISGDRGRLTFEVIDDLAARSQTLELDANAMTLSQDIEGVFVARKKNGLPKATLAQPASATFSDFAKILSVRKDRPPQKGERIALTILGGMSLDTSVSGFFQKTGGRWQLSDLGQGCGRQAQASADASFSGSAWTKPTVTIQSDFPTIVSLAHRLGAGAKDRCAIIDSCTRYVFASLAKRNTATFSNAVETLKAGFGDCGEHAVLLAALLRAENIPARVVLGLVYFGPENGFVGHAWVMAHDGAQWIFCDPAFGLFPAGQNRIPLIIDDNGAHAVLLIRYIDRIGVDYVQR